MLSDHINGINQESDKDELAISSPSIKTPSTPRITFLPDDIFDALRNQNLQEHRVEEVLSLQKAKVVEQDGLLEEMNIIAQRNKQIALAIKSEVKEQNKLLDDIASQTDEANAKVNVANRRVQRI